ncbi:MAG: glycosyltransferase family 2 protein [Patescibacteria group bacterium]
MKLAVIIPAYNEEKTIGKVLASLPKKFKGIESIISIVIDDGSTDRTFEVARKYTSCIAKHIINLGVGAALCTGFEAAKKIGADIAVTIDADGQHNPKDIHLLVEPIVRGEANVVIGTRMLNTKGMPGIKIFGNWVMNFITVFIFHIWSTDTQSGLRAYDKIALSKFNLHSLGYEISSEIIGEVRRTRLRMCEVPIETIYTHYSKRKGQNWINGVNVLTRLLTIKLTGKK